MATWSLLPTLPMDSMPRWLLRGDSIAQEIQLSIQYAPNPVFLHSRTPETEKEHPPFQSFVFLT
jgi:hypothetical protein